MHAIMLSDQTYPSLQTLISSCKENSKYFLPSFVGHLVHSHTYGHPALHEHTGTISACLTTVLSTDNHDRKPETSLLEHDSSYQNGPATTTYS